MCKFESPQSHEVINAEPSGLIPRKLTASVELLIVFHSPLRRASGARQVLM